MPDFFVIGHAKCGTTALYEMLCKHPQIYMPEYKRGAGKEPWYFSRDNPNPQLTDKRSVEFTGRKGMTLQEYLSLFSEAGENQVLGEASTSYIWSRGAAERIARARPDACIIAILREPASFLRSLHQQLLVNRHEIESDFCKAVALDQPRREARLIPRRSYWPQALIYSARVRYVEQLRRYHAVFPSEQVKIVIYDDFRNDNEATVRDLLHFLGVREDVPIVPQDANPSVGIHSMRLDELRRALKQGRGPVLRLARGSGRALTTRRFREAVFYPLQKRAVYGAPPAPDEEFMNLLRRRFKPEVEALSEYLDRDFVALWGYDSG